MFNSVNPQGHERLTMPLSLLVALSSTLLEDDGLVSLRFLLDRRMNSRVLDLWTSNSCIIDSANHEDIVDANL